MRVIRYSPAFKMQVVREVESGQDCAQAVQRKYNIRGAGTVLRWAGSKTIGSQNSAP